MNKTWEVLRIIDFCMASTCFFVLMYRGVFKMVSNPDYFSWERFMNLLWCFGSAYGVTEVLFMGVRGGSRVIVNTVVLIVQMYVVFFQSPFLDPGTPLPRKYRSE